MVARVPVERIGPGDAMQLASDVGPAPLHVAAVLVLAPPAGPAAPTPADVAATLARRAGGVPRLRQVLVPAPPGLGRPYWVAASTDAASHVAVERCPAPGDRAALLRLASDVAGRRLRRDRPLWRAVVVTGLDDGALAVVVVLHHVLADGLGGLAVLDRLVDPPAGDDAAGALAAHAAGRATPEPRPGTRDLLADVVAERRAAVRRLPAALAVVRAAVAEVGVAGPRSSGPGTAPRCSLNAPTGTRRRLATAGVPLEPLRVAARRHGATVNDALLVATTAALADLLARRGERLPSLVVSVPVAARPADRGSALGNAVGVMRVRVPLTGPPADRLADVAAVTRARKTPRRGASAALVGPAFRLLRALGLFRPLVAHQRLVNVFLTNVVGPPGSRRLAGAEVRELVPVTLNAGNVAVAVAALSYAGRLTASVVVDPDLVPELPELAADLATHLGRLAAL